MPPPLARCSRSLLTATRARRPTGSLPRRCSTTDASAPRRLSSTSALPLTSVVVALATGYALCMAFPPQFQLYRLLRPQVAPAAPDANSPAGIAYSEAIERQMNELELVKGLKADRNFKVSRPYKRYNEDKRQHSLLAGALKGPGKIATPPMVFSTADDKEATMIVHLGRSMCGHDGVVHGGLLASLLDEGTARPAILALPTQLGVTANLNVNYRSPCMADQFIVMRVKLQRQEGRKAWAYGRIETLDGTLLCEATALYVQPKFAAFLSSSSVKEALS